MPNGGDGIDIIGDATQEEIGGVRATGDTTCNDGLCNLISGNSGSGIYLSDSGTTNNTIQGNFVGTNVAGTAGIANGQYGVYAAKGAAANAIGGTRAAGDSACDGSCNLISGNSKYGVYLSDNGTAANVVEGNFIGTDVTGKAGVPDGIGVEVYNGAARNTIGGTRESSSCDAACNLIAGNSASGVALVGSGTAANVVQGNFIGVDASSQQAPLGNGAGVLVANGATQNNIGGARATGDTTCTALCNLISGNVLHGVWLGGTGTRGNTVEGNFIGTDVAGLAARGNGADGIYVDSGAAANTIGGARAPGSTSCDGPCNLVSANSYNGIELAGTGTDNNLIQGNFVGTDFTGATALPNASVDSSSAGVEVDTAATLNTIGGTRPPGDTACDNTCNLISGNSHDGVLLQDAGTTRNTVAGNVVGTTIAGTAALANGSAGVAVSGGAVQNTVGGTRSSTSCDGPCNLISGNVANGVDVNGSGTNRNVVQGNYVGLDTTGKSALPNGVAGVGVEAGAAQTTVGGARASGDTTCDGPCNLIGGNAGDGVDVEGTGTNGTTLQGNFIGTDASGASAVPNAANGIGVLTGATRSGIGGARPSGDTACDGPCNLISGNALTGISLSGTGVSSNTVQGNFVGPTIAGTTAVANAGGGIVVNNGAVQNTIGGARASTACDGACNVVSGNGAAGVVLLSAGTSGNMVQGNVVGATNAGTASLPNNGDGVTIGSGAAHTIVGGAGTAGTCAATCNLITGNAHNGVTIGLNAADSATTGNSVRGNAIHDNTALGIDLGNDGVTANGPAGRSGPNTWMNYPEGLSAVFDGVNTTISGVLTTTAPQSATVDLYADAAPGSSGYGEGQVWLGAATPDNGGNFALTVGGALPYGFVSATATNSSGSTSEFALAQPVGRAGQPSAAITLSPSTGTVSSTVIVSGTMFGAGEPVSLYWDSANSAPLRVAVANGLGAFAVTFTVPLAISGTHTVLALGQASGSLARAAFAVKPATTLAHASGAQSSANNVRGTGFGAGETVKVFWNVAGGRLLGTGTTSAVGSFSSITFTVPLSPTGVYRVVSVGQSSGATATSAFTLRPSLLINPTSGAAGSAASVSGTGYGARETVTVKWNCAGATCSSTVQLGSAVTDASGDFNGLMVTIPATAPKGPHAVGGLGGLSGAFAGTTFTVK